MLYRVRLAWAGFKLTPLVVIGTDGIGSYKSNYHTIATSTDPRYLNKRSILFISKKNFQIPLRIKCPSPKRYIGGSRGGQAPFFVLGYRLVKTYFSRIFPVSFLSFFFLPCLVIFALNYVSVSFDIKKKMVSEMKRVPYGNVWIRLSDTYTCIHCRTVWSVVNCWIRYSDLCCRLCKMFCFGESVCQAFV